MTRSAVGAEPVSIGTLARVASWRVLADTDAEIVILKFHALVYVGAGAVVGVQSKPGVAAAPITAPDVEAHVLTESRYALALVDVLSKTVIPFVETTHRHGKESSVELT